VVNEATQCWEPAPPWRKGAPPRKPGYEKRYRRMSIDGVFDHVHRHAHRAFIGPIPDGYDIAHLCHNRVCCNPAHLEAMSPADNIVQRDARWVGLPAWEGFADG
jgi:hypothetical protein